MMASAASLKKRYSSRWKIAATREASVYAWLRYFAGIYGLEVYATGVGTLSDDYVPRSFTGLEDKYDFTMYARGKPVLYFDVTGYGGREPCFLSVKLVYALRYGVADRVILIHVNDDSGAIRWCTAAHLASLVNKGLAKPRKLPGREDERDYICTNTKHLNRLKELKTFIALKVMN